MDEQQKQMITILGVVLVGGLSVVAVGLAYDILVTIMTVRNLYTWLIG